MSEDRTFVTGFLAFEGFDINPSAVLAQRCGRRFELIEVSYSAVDAFVDRLDLDSFDRWLMLGVAARSSRMRTENFARNVVGGRSDVRGHTPVGEIEPGGPAQIAGTMWNSSSFSIESRVRRPSDNAGDYLCNYIYYLRLRKIAGTGKAIGFLHIPPFEQLELATQVAELRNILAEIEAMRAGASTL
ncbi:pyroglutamyl-peptidase I [soil metagenome]